MLAQKSIPNADLDLLFVIDDSATMADKQQALAAAFPAFIAELATAEGGLPSLHIGVVSSDMGTSGSDGTVAPQIGQPGAGGCAMTGKAGVLQTNGAPIDGTFITDLQLSGGSRQTNYTGTLADVFAQMAQLGTTGCGFEQHLAAMRAGLSNPANTGFRRAGANLAVVILGDEDDCSVKNTTFFGPESTTLGPLDSFRCFRFGVECSPDEPNVVGSKTGCKPRAASDFMDDVAPFRTFLAEQQPDARQLMVGVLAGATSPVAVELVSPPGGGTPRPSLAASCTFASTTGEAKSVPGIRLAALLDGLPARTHFEPLCSPDLAPAMTALAENAKPLVGDTCLAIAIADTSADPGLQPDCVLVETRDSAPDQPQEIPACDLSSSGTCFRLVEDRARCASGQGLRLDVQRAVPAAADAWLSLRCRLP
ncbi:MAG TPA: hypothetical protein VFQ53_13730 [Kofleriaceae bacterium]|nr:hypothetical protein [Kofleriaceae bacterium]